MDISTRLTNCLKSSRFELVELQEESFLITLHDIPSNQKFTVLCDSEWKPMFLEVDQSSEETQNLREWSNTVSIFLQENSLSLERFVQHAQEYLEPIAPDTRQKSAGEPSRDQIPREEEVKVEETETPPENENQISSELNQPPTNTTIQQTSSQTGIFAMEEEQEVVPTLEDWQRIIIPNLRMFLVDHQHQLYEIEEYARVIQRHLDQGNFEKAHEFVRNNILSGQPAPSIISRFFPRRRSYRPGSYRGVLPISYTNRTNYNNNTPIDHLSPFRRIVNGYSTTGGSDEGTQVLREQLHFLYTTQTKKYGFEVEILHDHLYHWLIKMTEFDGENTQLGQDLIQHHAVHSDSARYHDYGEAPKKQTSIHIELKFPLEYPFLIPSIRVVQPQFNQDIDGLLFETLTSLAHKSHSISSPLSVPTTSPTSPTTTTSTSDFNATTTTTTTLSSETTPEGETNGEKKGTDNDNTFDTFDDWSNKHSIGTAILAIRSKLIRYSNGIDINEPLRVKIEEPSKGLVTIDGFWNRYQPISYGRPEIERGGKIILPSSALAEISTEMETPSFNYYRSTLSQRFGVNSRGGSEGPLTFEIMNPLTHKKTYCGVLEFTADEDTAIIPKWMMKNLGLTSGEDVELEIRRVSLPTATFVRFQPHHVDFLYLENPKAMLEWVLTSYSALCIGDTIPINFNNKTHLLNVLETKPGRAVSIVDSDVSVDFAPPLVGQYQPFSTLSSESPTGSPSSLGSKSPAGTPQGTPKDTFSSVSGSGNVMTTNFDDGVVGVHYEICSNCCQKISKAQYTIHSISCARINYFCHACNRVVQKTQKKEHEEEFHSLVPCTLGCGKNVEIYSMDLHKQYECPHRMVDCIYCELKVLASEIEDHQQKCGDITEPCPECKQRVMRRYMFEHPQICGKAQPMPSQTSRRRSMILCPECKFPFEDFEELQIHVLTVHDPTKSLTNSSTTMPMESEQTPSEPTPSSSSSSSSSSRVIEADIDIETPPDDDEFEDDDINDDMDTQ